MPKSTIKKLNILVTREVLDRFLNEFLILGCAEISEAIDLPENSDLHAFVKRELVDLVPFGASKDSLSVLGTKYTVMLTGWLPFRHEPELVTLLKKYGCAWDISDPIFSDIDVAPVELCCPWFLGKYRLAGRRRFTPLVLIIEKNSADNYEIEDGENI